MNGAAWLRSAGVANVSPAAARVAELLDEAFGGIYHLQDEVLRKGVNWSDERFVSIVLYGELATFDFDQLTRLVLLAHERAIRVSLEGCGPKRLRVYFHPRRHRTEQDAAPHAFEWHPTIEQAVVRILKRPVTA